MRAGDDRVGCDWRRRHIQRLYVVSGHNCNSFRSNVYRKRMLVAEAASEGVDVDIRSIGMYRGLYSSR